MSHCKERLAGQAACSVEALLSNTTVRAILGCEGSLSDCQAKCLDALGTLGLPINSTAASCTAADQLMMQHSGSPGLLLEFIPSPSGLPQPRLVPGSLADMSSIPSFAFLGDYQSCMLGSGMQYCLVDGKLPVGGGIFGKNMKLSSLMGLCRPSECTAEEVHKDVEGTLGPLHLKDYKVSCHAPTEKAPAILWTSGRIAAMALFAALGLLAALGTRADLQRKWREEEAARPVEAAAPLCDDARPQAPSPGWKGLLSAFSLVRNGESFSRVRPQDPEGPAFACLDGLRVLSTLWVILGHCVIWPLLSVNYEQSSMILPPQGRLTETWFQIVPGGYFAVDTFFWLSGFLGAHSLHAKVRRSPGLLSLRGFAGKLYPATLLGRWLRLSIVYAFVLLFTQTWYRPLGRAAPLWDADTSFAGACVSSIDNDRCKMKWWANLLYVNNLSSLGGMNTCMNWTWYLACDMQMFLTLPLFVLLRERGGKLAGWLTLAAALLASIIANWVIIWEGKLVTDPVLGNAGAGGKFMSDVYEVAWTRAQPYFIGIGCAWVLGALHSRGARDLAASTGAGADMEAPVPAERMAQSLLGGQAEVEAAPRKAPAGAAAEGVAVDSLAGSCTSVRPPFRRSTVGRALLAVALQLLSFAAMCFVVFIPVTRYRCEKFSDCVDIDKAPWSPTANALYGSLNHAVWGLGLGCLMVLCALRAPGTWWVNTLLGAEFWQGPAKLTYVAYLVHPLVLVLFYCTRLRPVQYLDTILVQNFVAYATIVFMVSFVVWLAVEKPAANLTAQLMGALVGGARRT